MSENYTVKFKDDIAFSMAYDMTSGDIDMSGEDRTISFAHEDEFNEYIEMYVMNRIDIESTTMPDVEESLVTVEEIFFEKNDFVNSYSSITGDYEDFMMLTILEGGSTDDVVIIQDFYIGDTNIKSDVVLSQKDLDNGAMKHYPSEDTLKKVINDAKKDLTKEIGSDTKGYIYICKRDDDEFSTGVCVSLVPLKKATQDDWTVIL